MVELDNFKSNVFQISELICLSFASFDEVLKDRKDAGQWATKFVGAELGNLL